MLHDLATTVAIAVGGGAIYGAIFFAENHNRTGEPFDAWHFVSTLLVAAGIGAAGWVAGVEVTSVYTVEMLMAYGFVTVMVERILRMIRDRSTEQRRDPAQTPGDETV